MADLVLYKDVHVIDYEQNRIIRKDVTDDLNGYIISLVRSIEASDRLQYYKLEDETKHVINNIKIIINGVIGGETKEIPQHMKNIANRLLEKEVKAQDKVEKLGVNVKRGSLLQTVFYNNTKDEYSYLITKTQHTEYMEENEFSIQRGFKTDNNNLWKSCLVQVIKEDNELTIGDIKVYLDNAASYWHKEFLELIPVREDEMNTKVLFTSIEKALKKHIHNENKHEYIILRNSVINYIRRSELIDYYKLIEEIFEKYESTELNSEIKENLVNNLKELGKKDKFDIQFNVDPKALNVRVIKQCYELTNDIDLIIKDSTKIFDNISSVQDDLGNKYIKIKTNNIDAFETFLSNK